MGGDISRKSQKRGAAAERRFSVGFLSIMRDSITHRLGHSAVFSAGCGPLVPQVLLPPGDKAQTTEVDLNSVFLPEFPHRTFPEGERHKILGFIAKGSYGPIVRVKDNFKDQVFAVKVLPKSEIIKNKVVDQIKEEVIIQRQLEHPFIHSLHDSWQTQRHLFIMCSHCSHGDLHTYWSLKSQFEEKEVRLFATELGSALGFIHDLGIMHRDVKMENVLNVGSVLVHTSAAASGPVLHALVPAPMTHFCSSPEVLSGGPYSHAADWWSLGILMFALVTGKFPVPAELDHIAMLSKVRNCHYVIPESYSSTLILLLTELLCKSPAHRLRNLESFQMQPFFRGFSFDPLILQKTPTDIILQLRGHPDWTVKARRGLSLEDFNNFDCEEVSLEMNVL
ncbi:ribosomal protein S6 kinase-related protein isoform X2 [Takifugu flavidus]|uniref:ribosomal protein S6 kinase-related protein isoform X2 n=1 Tax=Takifugu flavidus TaxID=433684 RepID=UPI002544643D|nr:ribosomal protein S6 kinase-related protein isoform X2 [Takifugu flavidus]